MARRNNAAGARRPPRRSERRSRPIPEARPEASESLSDQPRAWRMIQSGRESEEKANATRLEWPGLWATLETGRCEKTKTPTRRHEGAPPRTGWTRLRFPVPGENQNDSADEAD